jgi:DNA-binding MarR family transcriptional regulator
VASDNLRISEAPQLEAPEAPFVLDFETCLHGAPLLRSLSAHLPDVDPDTIRVARGISITHLLLMATADEFVRQAGLSWSKLFVLLWLRAAQEAAGTGLAPSALSDYLNVTRNTVSALLSGLERQGYISRELNADDKRRFVMRLTPAGDTAVQACAAPLFAHLDTILGQMRPAERQALLDSLTQLRDLLLTDLRP